MASRERLRIYLRKRQIIGPLDPSDPFSALGNVIVQCNPDNTATYVPGTISNPWIEFTELTTGLDKLDLSWDKVNSGTSGESVETNPGGSNYDKGISVSVTFNDAAYQFIYDWLLDSPCGILNAIDVMITDELCQRQYRIFEIKADNLSYSPFGAPCEFEIKLREADPVWHCVHKTFIWDNWQNWFSDTSSKQHPCFLTGVEPRPRLLASARMGFSIFAHSPPILLLGAWGILLTNLINNTNDVFRRILNVDNFVDAPLVRDIITNVCNKCGIAIDTMFHDPANPYYNLCLFYPGAGEMHSNDEADVTSPALWFHFGNRWDITLADLLDKLKIVFNAEWYVTPGNTLIFKPKFTFLNNPTIFDFTVNPDTWDKYSLNYTFNGNKKPAYGRYQYTIDGSDLASQELKPLYNDIVDYDGPSNNLMLEGNVTKNLEFAPTGAIRDGRAKEDYLRETVSDGEQVAYAIVILLVVMIASLFAGVLSAGAGVALLAIFILWAVNIAQKANELRAIFSSATYTGAVRITSEQTAAPRLIIWNGLSMNRAKMVSVDPAAIAPNLYYNPTSITYTARNVFPYSPAAVFNYPMFFDSYFINNLYDRYHDALDNPLKSMDSHQTFEFNAYLCCEILDVLGVWDGDFSKIGYFIKLETRANYDVMGRIEHFEVNYDDETVKIRGQVYKRYPGSTGAGIYVVAYDIEYV